MSETVQNICHHFHNIHQDSGNYLYPILFTVSIDDALFVKYWKIIEIHEAFAWGTN